MVSLHFSSAESPCNSPAKPTTMLAFINTVKMFIGQCRWTSAKFLCVLTRRLPSALHRFPTIPSYHSWSPPYCVEKHDSKHAVCGAAGSPAIDRAAHALAAQVEHLHVDHSRTDILVSKELLDRADVVARLEQMGPSAWRRVWRQPLVAVEPSEDRLHLIAREHHGQPPGLAGPDKVGQLTDLAAADVGGSSKGRSSVEGAALSAANASSRRSFCCGCRGLTRTCSGRPNELQSRTRQPCASRARRAAGASPTWMRKKPAAVGSVTHPRARRPALRRSRSPVSSSTERRWCSRSLSAATPAAWAQALTLQGGAAARSAAARPGSPMACPRRRPARPQYLVIECSTTRLPAASRSACHCGSGSRSQ